MSPAVVYIQTETRTPVQSPLSYRPLVQVQSGSGTGVVVHEDGYVITNYHVVRDTDRGGRIRVRSWMIGNCIGPNC
ncbi:MAG: S1C family serine protease [Planctomycetota bacterium]